MSFIRHKLHTLYIERSYCLCEIRKNLVTYPGKDIILFSQKKAKVRLTDIFAYFIDSISLKLNKIRKKKNNYVINFGRSVAYLQILSKTAYCTPCICSSGVANTLITKSSNCEF